MKSIEQYFSHRKVLVTGGLGFLGQNLALRLLAFGANVTILDTSLNLPVFDAGAARIVRADIREEAELTHLIAGQEFIFNLAGKSGVVASNENPLEDLDINCRGHLSLLEACRKHNPEVRIIFPSTRLVYGKPLQLPVSENHSLAPESIYAANKLAGENYHMIYGRLYGLRVTVLRISNPYGPWQASRGRSYGIANIIIQKACRRDKITLFGDGGQLRDFLYVDDLSDVLLLSAISARAVGKVYNVGSETVASLSELAHLAVTAAGGGTIETIPWPEDYGKVETGDYRTDITLIKQDLNWSPRISLAEGVARTVCAYQGDGLDPFVE
jgi:UDP-glucose 4-epimerase